MALNTVTRGRRMLPRLVALLPALCALTCTDAPDPADAGALPQGLLVRPLFSAYGGSASSASVDRVRITLRDSAETRVLASLDTAVDPHAASWQLRLTVDVPAGELAGRVDIELLNNGTSSVEWSGASPVVRLRASDAAQAIAPINVYRGPLSNLSVTKLAIDERALSPLEADTVRLHATASTSASESPRIYWSTLDPDIAVVDATGVLRGRRDGDARVVAEAGAHADTVVVHVKARPARVSLQSDTARADGLGETVSFHASVFDIRGASIADAAVRWESADQQLAESLGDGRFLVHANGAVAVMAKAVTDSAARATGVIVVQQRVGSVRIGSSPATFEAVGDTAFASAVVADRNGTPMSAPIMWSSRDDAVVRVDHDGRIVAVAKGATRVIAAADGASDSIDVTVDPAPASIGIAPDHIGFTQLEHALPLQAHVFDRRGNAMTTVVTWTSSDANVASVSATGVVTSHANGQAMISAHAGGASASIPVLVKTRSVASLDAVSGRNVNGTVGATLDDPLAVIVRGDDGEPMAGIAVAWSAEAGSLSAAETVTDEEGVARVSWTLGTRSGHYDAVASVAEFSGTVRFSANAHADKPAKASKKSGGITATVALGLHDMVEVQVLDRFDNPVPGATVTWRVTGGHSVLPGGGTTYESLTDDDGRTFLDWSGFDTHVDLHRLRASIAGSDIELEIQKQTKPDRIRKMHLTPPSARITSIDDEFEFDASPTDQFDNPVDTDSITWNVRDADTVSVVPAPKGKGRVKARDAGVTVLRATAEAEGVTIEDSATVEVVQTSTTAVTITGPSSVSDHGHITLQAHGTDARGHALKKFQWSIVSGAEFVELGHNGKDRMDVDGVAEGTAVLRATDPGGSFADVTITVDHHTGLRVSISSIWSGARAAEKK